MRKIVKIVLVSAVIALFPLLLLSQTPPHPNGGNAPGSGNTPVGGGAPLDGGIVMLIVLGTIYGSKKTLSFLKKK